MKICKLPSGLYYNLPANLIVELKALLLTIRLIWYDEVSQLLEIVYGLL